MAMSQPKVRIIANACITRYDSGEGGIIDIVNSYNMAAVDQELVLAQVYARRPDLEDAVPAAE
ncbi:hypothetical protein SAMN02799630_01235 [Paenibacillus sp. UNCCL117]|uniref:hypothetical protein n=1 Tax=unclassified Paenibacillus TaxID=185978 RepID=UPI0008924D1B|nr:MULTISPECIES: hypothetical protein [unclassified Paenibacillus]SDC70478.1 hypothetical protein SAMN04488602_103213 [Paenibacillus sp. cl123]SFW24206.1 hypothetical protein SAMN02799630_01235 [Paenibacillus sp. UNCCL117]